MLPRLLLFLSLSISLCFGQNGTFSFIPTYPGPQMIYNDPNTLLNVPRIDVTFFPNNIANVSVSLYAVIKNSYLYHLRADLNMTYSITGQGQPTGISFGWGFVSSYCVQNITTVFFCDYLPLVIAGDYGLKAFETFRNTTMGLLIGRSEVGVPWANLPATTTLVCQSLNCGSIPVIALTTGINGINGPVRPHWMLRAFLWVLNKLPRLL